MVDRKEGEGGVVEGRGKDKMKSVVEGKEVREKEGVVGKAEGDDRCKKMKMEEVREMTKGVGGGASFID